MSVWVDSKGKVFTEVIHKDELPVLIQMATGQIRGRVYVHPDHRLIDEMNGAARFIAVTGAEVIGPDGEVAYRAAFLTLNKRQVVWIRPDEEAGRAEAAE
jgi:hypothetical protein